MADNKAEKSSVAKREEEILKFWQEHKIFEKSLAKSSPKGEYVFYDGPPFATGLPHYGHILASTIKDAIPRYQTMRGHRVVRRWGWDCHGLPLENEIEKELDLKSKKDIEDLGIDKFNEAARAAVLRYADDWKRIIPRVGRWVDMEHDYKTMDTSYTESVWWIFKTLYEKGLIYRGFKSMHLCPRCGTTLSNFEVNLGYKDITDISVYVELPLRDDPNTRLLVWTTTPWTLPGNMAAAVNRDVEYVTVEKKDNGEGPLVRFILAKEKLEEVFGDDEYTVVDTYKGERLVGKTYTPPFDYYQDKDIEHKENAWKIYHAPYVTTEDGTGIVHLAPAYGEEDLLLAEKEHIPIVHHVGMDGHFVDAVIDFSGMMAKPKDDPQSTDIAIIKHLAGSGDLFDKKKITHSYPHCWRCDTPLLNYATTSWFVRVVDFKDKLVSENKKIGWVPPEVGENRFGKWLEGARDWAISRSRYWGAPLPVWRDEKTGEQVVIGSVDELKKRVKRSENRYFLMRHGEAVSNVKGVVSSGIATDDGLTEKGKEQVANAARKIVGEGVNLIVASPFQRTRETIAIVAKEIGLPEEAIVYDERLQEIQLNTFDGKKVSEYHEFLDGGSWWNQKPEGGESWLDVKRRSAAVLYDLEKQYQGKTILVISHNSPLRMIESAAHGWKLDTPFNHDDDGKRFGNGEVRKLDFVPLPHNDDYELDLHRPYIDAVELETTDGAGLVRVPDVFDCWFESGSMPYGQQHYPFENLDVFEPKGGWLSGSKGYPADFIAEGVDQTRGWFYSLIVLGVALFGKAPYKHVIVNGLVQAEDGKKMSKRLKNYPDPMDVTDKYGADALRYYLLSSPIVRGEDLNFSEKGVDEVMKKLVVRLSNVYSFYELYKAESSGDSSLSGNVLDRWILSRLSQLIEEITKSMEAYELDRATRPLMTFVDDFSTWYLRRSRERFKGDDEEDKYHAITTIRFVLKELSKLMAPFMPFYADALYRDVRGGNEPESVHLCDWPEPTTPDKDVLTNMALVRTVVTEALEARSQAGVKVRQPLASLSIKNSLLDGKDEYLDLLRDEVNVREVFVDETLEKPVVLDTELTDQLKREGAFRDIARMVQDMRKRSGLEPGEVAVLFVGTDNDGEEILAPFVDELKRTASLTDVSFTSLTAGEELVVNGTSFVFKLDAKV